MDISPQLIQWIKNLQKISITADEKNENETKCINNNMSFRSYKKTTKSELINQVFFYLRFWWPTLALGCLWCNCDRISCLIVSLWSCGYPELPWKLCQPLSKLRKFGWWYWCWAGTKAYCCCTICEKRTVGLHGTCEL